MAVTREEETEAERAERERKELEAKRDRDARSSVFGFLIGLLEGPKKPGKP